MPAVRDPHGTQWTVRRRWWPFFGFFDVLDVANMGWFGLLLALPLFVLWPFWLLTKFLGARWRIEIQRGDDEKQRELVRGWGASKRRINDIAASIADGQVSGTFVI